MAALLTAQQVRGRGIATPLSDDDLQAVIDGEDQFIVDRRGPHAAMDSDRITQEVESRIRRPQLLLDRMPRIIERVRHIQAGQNPDDWTVLDAGDYRIVADSYTIARTDGGNWYGRYEVVYGPVHDTALRESVLLDLVKHELAFGGYASANVPGFTYSWSMEQKEAIVRRIRNPWVGA